ncbi:MAG: xanthine dehydrogenase family protein molybdopterin-binding subunit [Methylocystaceae bacterium]|nr:xanthine dehydrogenase family protein molybdopterin-binding subunit [Methylocystaceae bacterium]
MVIGTQSNGQGHETSFPQLMEHLLNVPTTMFRYIQANTNLVPTGGGHGGARSLHMAGTALYAASQDFIYKAKAFAASLLQTDAQSIFYEKGIFYTSSQTQLKGPHIALSDLLTATDKTHSDKWFEGYGAVKQAPITFPNGCHIAEIELDPDTGKIDILKYVAVDDYGRLINPMLTESQIQGGIAQGIGQALMEGIHYDSDTGQLLTSTFMDYAVPRAKDIPWLEIALVECPTAANPLGVKGAGQAGTIAAPHTIMNALINALKPYGITHIDMPATPGRILTSIQTSRMPQIK